jgi:hypothetical protein
VRGFIACCAALSACTISVDYGGTRFSCAIDGQCPTGFECVADVCVPPGTGADASVLGFERELVIDHGAGASPLADFPLMIRLDATRIEYEVCHPEGRDVRFFAADGALLEREIERWDPAGTSVIWVKVPRIEPAASGAVVTMRYGDGIVTDDNPEALWGDFAAVYHLAGGDDSSPSGFDGNVVGAAAIDGFIGPALRFTGAGEHVDLGIDRPFLRAQTAATVTAWARLDPGWIASGVVFATSIDNLGAPTNASRLQVVVRDDRSVQGTARSMDSGSPIDVIGPMLAEDAWTHLAFTVDFTSDWMQLFADGALVATAEGLGLGPTRADSVSTQTIIGRGEIPDVDLYVGDIDEVRLAHQLRSDNFIAADRRSTADEMVTFGAVTTITD